MLNELVKRIGNRTGGERRAAERLRKKYTVAWLKGTDLVPSIAIEISEKGIFFATREAPKGGTVEVMMGLDKVRVRARLTIARRARFQKAGVEYAAIAGVFQGIAADDWDAIVRFCRGIVAPVNKAKTELDKLADNPDDAYRLLPLAVQQKIVGLLVKAHRLAPTSESQIPLLRMQYSGRGKDGSHKLAVHSRRNVDGEMIQHDSIISVDDSNNVVLEK
jgi:hypothetical protein